MPERIRRAMRSIRTEAEEPSARFRHRLLVGVVVAGLVLAARWAAGV